MKLLDLGRRRAAPITRFESTKAWSVMGATGSGITHVYTIHFEAGGSIGRHPAGPAQLFLVVEGEGWVEGGDAIRRSIRSGEAACLAPGEVHAKGSDSGMTAVMIQVEELEPTAALLDS